MSADEDRVPAIVSVLIMVVSLVAAGMAYLETGAGNEASFASRQADAFAVSALRDLAVADSEISHQSTLYALSNDQGWLSNALQGQDRDLASALAQGHGAAWIHAAEFSDVLGTRFYDPDSQVIDWVRFGEETRRPVYEALENQKAYEQVAAAWGNKSSRYVAVITVLAASLFLLGLTLKIAVESRSTLIVAGLLLAGSATLWGVGTYLAPEDDVSPKAIEAFVDGFIEVTAAQDRDGLSAAADLFTRAIERDPDYRSALLGRSYALLRHDTLDPDGPKGSQQAEADLRFALSLDDRDALAWGNYGAALFWLGEYQESIEATLEALELDPENPTWLFNLALLRSSGSDEAGYLKAVAALRESLLGLPSWLREANVGQYTSVLDIVATHRLELADSARDLRERVVRASHEASVARRFFGTSQPSPVEGVVGGFRLRLGGDSNTVIGEFEYRGMQAGRQWMYVTYVDGREEPSMRFGPTTWDLEVPDSAALLTVTAPEPVTGHTVRIEVYVEGALLGVAEREF